MLKHKNFLYKSEGRVHCPLLKLQDKEINLKKIIAVNYAIQLLQKGRLKKKNL